jgi:cytochrome c556
MRTRTLRHLVLFTLLTVLVGVGLAAAQSATMPVPGDVVAARQRLMRLNAASAADAQAKLKAGNIEAIAVNAEVIAINASHIPFLFPQGSDTPASYAKPEVWEKRADFEAAAKNMEAMAEKLRDTAKSKDAAATEAIMKEFGAKTCGACHTVFRRPKN